MAWLMKLAEELRPLPCGCDNVYATRPRLGPIHGHVVVDFTSRVHDGTPPAHMGLVFVPDRAAPLPVRPWDEGWIRGRLRARKLKRWKLAWARARSLQEGQAATAVKKTLS